MGSKEHMNGARGEKSIEAPNRLQVALYSGKQHRNFFRSIYPHSYYWIYFSCRCRFLYGGMHRAS